MILLELVLQNFGPYQGTQVINLSPFSEAETENISRPILLLGGMNGGGKTTLMDAIRLALYGHRAQCSTRGSLSYSDFLTQCVNSHTSPTEKTRIELAFGHIENDKPVVYRIVRTWEKNPKDGKDVLGILNDDEWLNSGLVSIWDEYIENLLPLGISNLFLFDGEQIKELAEQETPPLVVVEAIRGLLGLELSERLAVDLEILVNRKRKEIADAKDVVNLEEIEEKLKVLQDKQNAENLQLISLQDDLTLAEKERQETFNKFLAEGGKIAADRSQLEQQHQTKNATAETARQAMRELASDVLPLALITPLLEQARSQAETEINRARSQVAQDILLERNQRLLTQISNINITAEQLDKIKILLEQDVETFHGTSLQESSWLQSDRETLDYLTNLLNSALPIAKNSAQQQQTILEQQAAEIVDLERQLQTAASPEAYQQLVETLQTAQNRVTDIKANCETAKRRILELETAIAQTKKDLNEYTEQTIDRKNTEHVITSASKVQETLKLFRERLTLRKLNKLEVEVTECFRYLLHKSDLVHRIAIATNTFSLSLYDLQGKPVPKHRLSAGEKQLLAIAFLWGLARVSGRRLPIAIDTPLGRLDSSHRQNLVERYFPSASHQVILLSTDTEIGEKEVHTLRQNEAIAREYLLKYDPTERQTTIEPGYFW
ncbi:DNA sulfur modification protein DndD [Chroococcidiopsis thermalis]|jgi:DNA sulfur modification protein DndD|uniref:Nuclease SbcCD subunit C n=1 Tax=Chroococcidiopsis thermalis (strain PCC 7203) TaxID=251229 RepID=K9U0J1_CHRTP|nr:DNA sulfur modification protein DndD [Chroococcidiopsis thermalis]AFY88153.1 DNA sulfur modification protein DndD [Chroococcidiopsis thermalis PCC 7203]